MSEIMRLIVGPYKANCFIFSRGDQAIVIDPGAEEERVIEQIQSAGLTPLAVICTHGHIDHIGAVAAVKERFQIPAYIHGADAALVRRAHLYAAFFKASGRITIPQFDGDLRDCAEGLAIGPFAFSVIETPGHSDGGVCLAEGTNIFTGDTLFAHGHGGTKLPGGNPGKFATSIAVLAKLDPACTIHPGHGEAARLGDALNDPRLQDA